MSDPSLGSERNVADRREEHSTHQTTSMEPREEVKRREASELLKSDELGEEISEGFTV